MTQELALKILQDLKNSPNMANHGFAAGYTMRALYDHFKKEGKNPELSVDEWEMVGMLHDADYEITNKSLELHTEETTKLLKHYEINKLVIDAIRGHCGKEKRKTLMAKSIYACDELTGLIVACALVQPGEKLSSVNVESVLRKFRVKSFAAGANRKQIKTCETELDLPLEKFISIALSAMQAKARELGL